jgi:O-antigen/teichoic acid export membrane protein
MLIVITKLLEVMARALFVVAVTYALPLEAAGQFGIVVTLIGLFSFLIGWERHVDIQRRLVGEPDEEFDRAVSLALQLYLLNSIFMVPVLLFAIWWWAHLGGYILGLAAIIVVADQLGNQIYQFALVSSRFHKMLVITAVRNLTLMFAVAWPLWINHRLPGLTYVLEWWAIVSIISLAFASVAWMYIRKNTENTVSFRLGNNIFEQHKASITHFLLGLFAILNLQFDRIMVGGILEFRETGIYFRHLLLVSLVYQFFNIASYGRLVPLVFKMAKSGDNAGLDNLIVREWLKVTVVVMLIVLGIAIMDRLTERIVFNKYQLEWTLIFILVSAATIRIFADFNGMLLNSMNLEVKLLRLQIICFSASIIFGIALIFYLNYYGAAYTMLLSSFLYFLLTFWTVKRERRARL